MPSSVIAGEPTYIPPKTKGSRRTVPLPAARTTLLRNYLKRHPRRDELTAPPIPCMRLQAPRATGIRVGRRRARSGRDGRQRVTGACSRAFFAS